MKRIRKDKVKRGRIILSAILTVALSLLSLGFGCYLGYVTLNMNYVTIGTMTTEIGGLLVVAGFFIFFGCIGGVIALKELFIAHRNEDKFSAYKGALYSAIVFYVVIAIISIAGIISAFVSFVPSNFTWGIVGLAVLSLLLCSGCFYAVFKELKEHKKNKKKNQEQGQSAESGAFNMNLNAGEIRKFSNMQTMHQNSNANTSNMSSEIPQPQAESQQFSSNQYSYQSNVNDRHSNYPNQNNNGYNPIAEEIKSDIIHEKEQSGGEDINFVSLAEKLMQLEELRKAGLINDQEYQELKRKCI